MYLFSVQIKTYSILFYIQELTMTKYSNYTRITLRALEHSSHVGL